MCFCKCKNFDYLWGEDKQTPNYVVERMIFSARQSGRTRCLIDSLPDKGRYNVLCHNQDFAKQLKKQVIYHRGKEIADRGHFTSNINFLRGRAGPVFVDNAVLDKMNMDFVTNLQKHPEYYSFASTCDTIKVNVPVPDIDKVLKDVEEELFNAQSKFKPYNSGHEGYSVIKEELDELWDEVRLKTGTKERMYEEAKQVAATAIRFMLDVCMKNS